MERQYHSDGDLLRAYVETGHDEPFRQLMCRHGAMVMAVCRRASGRPADAEDLYQAVFLTLLQKAVSLKDRECLAGWLHRTAWHIAQRARRDATTRGRHEQEAARQRPASLPAPVANDEFFSLHMALNSLPDAYREAVILHHLENLSVEQTAKVLGRPVGTVAAQVSRARRMLRNQLQNLFGPAFAVAALGVLEPSSEKYPTALASEPVAVFVPRNPPPLVGCAAVATSGVASARVGTGAWGMATMLKAAAVTGTLLVSGAALGGVTSIEKALDAVVAVCSSGDSRPAPASGSGVTNGPSSSSSDNQVVYELGTVYSVPEPGSLSVLGIGALALLRRRR